MCYVFFYTSNIILEDIKWSKLLPCFFLFIFAFHKFWICFYFRFLKKIIPELLESRFHGAELQVLSFFFACFTDIHVCSAINFSLTCRLMSSVLMCWLPSSTDGLSGGYQKWIMNPQAFSWEDRPLSTSLYILHSHFLFNIPVYFGEQRWLCWSEGTLTMIATLDAQHSVPPLHWCS